MKTINRNWKALAGIFGSILIIVVTALTALSQTAPTLTITPLGTNVFSITITNNIGSSAYDLQWTPVLGNTVNYPWTWAVIATPGQTNFLVNGGNYQTAFFRTLLDTNSIPLWQAADPNNPGAGILTVFIDSPANSFNITQ